MGALDRQRKIVEAPSVADGDDDTVLVVGYRGRGNRFFVPNIKGYRAEYHRVDNENNPQATGQEKKVIIELATRASTLIDLPGFNFDRFNFADATEIEVAAAGGGVGTHTLFSPWIVCDIAVPALFLRVANDDTASGDNRAAQVQFVMEFEFLEITEIELMGLLLMHGWTDDDVRVYIQMPQRTGNIAQQEP